MPSQTSKSGAGQHLWVTYKGRTGPGRGKKIVLVSGDEEYRSEEALPLLGRILAARHGFHCTVLFAVDADTGIINPENQEHIPGLHQLEKADLMVLFTRFRELPDDQTKHIMDYTNSGRPILGLRTATHPFNYTRNPGSPFAKYSFNSKDPEGGYGRLVLGETWVSHHGHHGKESTRGVIPDEVKSHPILRGVRDIWGPTDVYTVRPLTGGDPQVLVQGQVLSGMKPTDVPNASKPTMPLAWTRSFTGEQGKASRVFCTTMGASVDLESEGLRRLLINACYWCMGMENRIPERSEAGIVGPFQPTFFGFGAHQKGVRPGDLAV
ncbi:MAG: ThuA domain-containing protein [Planctomycetes bacterium]|nr:ThuA domain-containing protein [Planctomycetota bacterium]